VAASVDPRDGSGIQPQTLGSLYPAPKHTQRACEAKASQLEWERSFLPHALRYSQREEVVMGTHPKYRLSRGWSLGQPNPKTSVSRDCRDLSEKLNSTGRSAEQKHAVLILEYTGSLEFHRDQPRNRVNLYICSPNHTVFTGMVARSAKSEMKRLSGLPRYFEKTQLNRAICRTNARRFDFTIAVCWTSVIT